MKKMLCILLALAACALPAGCAAEPDLGAYVSEYRSRIYEGTEGGYTVFASFTRREYPYRADGNAGEMQDLFEVALAAPDNARTYSIEYALGGEQYEAELAFDSVRMVHTCSLSLPEPTESSIAFTVRDAEDAEVAPLTITAACLRPAGALELPALLEKVRAAEAERFDALSNGRDFAGELYVRLACEGGASYYYIGLTDRGGHTYSMLADAVTGEIVATRE